jgi:dipeptidyl aminopeptidase/acylaminoacyl peptidase
MKIEKISWKSEGLKISGAIYIPEVPTGILPALIFCHGIPARWKGPDDRGYPLLAERFCRKGFLVLIFNFRGTGSSEGNFDLRGWARDLEGALDYLSRRPEVDRQRIFVMGFSGGAAVSIYVAARRKEIAGLISCASPAEFKDLITGRGLKDFLIHAREVGIVRDDHFPASLDDWERSFQTVKPLDWVDQIPPRPFLIVHGTDDRVVDVSQASALYEKVRGKAELFLIKGAEHRLRIDERAMTKAEEWLGEIAFSGQPSAFSQKIYSDR